MKKVHWLIATLSLVPFIAHAAVLTDEEIEAERIRGVSQFLLERANENFLYIFESKLQKNGYFAYYFPNTHYYAETGHLKTLLRSGGRVWQESVRTDLQCIRDRTISTILHKTDQYLRGFAEHYVFILQNLSLRIDGQDYPLDVLPLNAPRAVIDAINEFYGFTQGQQLAAFSSQSLGLRLDSTSANPQRGDCLDRNLPRVSNFTDIEQQMAQVKARANGIRQLIDTIKRNRDRLRVNDAAVAGVLQNNHRLNELKIELEQLKQQKQRLDDLQDSMRASIDKLNGKIQEVQSRISTLKQQLGSVEIPREELLPLVLSMYGEERLAKVNGDLAKLLDKPLPDHVQAFIDSFENRFYNYISFFDEIKRELKDLQQVCDATESRGCTHTVRVILVEKILQASVDNQTFQFLADFDQSKFTQLKRYMLFFGEIADAQTADTVQNLLEEITLPPVSFGKKRNPGEERVYITAYLGGALGVEDSVDGDDRDVGGFFAPIGLEYTFARTRGYSHSLMLSVLDFGHPINLEIENRNESVKLSDIFVPGIFYSLGLKEIPMTVGLGVNRGQAIEGQRRDDSRWLIYVGFDMPLFTVY